MRWNPADAAFVADPYPVYAALRDRGPQWCPSTQAWLVSGQPHVDALLRDRRLGRVFTPRRPAADFTVWNRLNALAMLELEPPEHPRQRRLVSRAFTSRRVEELRPRVRELCAQLLPAGGAFDLVTALAEPLPVAVIGALLGVPDADLPLLRPWSAAIVALYELDVTPEGERAAEQAAGEFDAYLRGLLAERRRAPADDLLSALAQAADGAERLSDDEIVAIGVLLLNAGHEATVNVIGNAVLALLDRPADRELLAGLADDAWPAAVDELIRYDTPLSLFFRTALADVTLDDGTVVAAGERVGLLLGAANRDPQTFVAPDGLDVGRTPNPHVGFGAGLHYCLGAPLARLEVAEALRALLRRGTHWRVTEPVTLRTTWQFRGPARLMLEVA